MELINSEVQEIETTQPSDPVPLTQEEIRSPLSDEKLQALQVEDKFAKISVISSNKGNYKTGTHIT